MRIAVVAVSVTALLPVSPALGVAIDAPVVASPMAVPAAPVLVERAQGWTLPPPPSKKKPDRPVAASRVKPRDVEPPRPVLPSIASLAIDFGQGTAIMTDSGRRQADMVYQVMQARGHSDQQYQVAGHTQHRGADALNVELSERRAAAVVDYLVSKGMPRETFLIKGVGGADPLPGIDPDATANRRVVITRLD